MYFKIWGSLMLTILKARIFKEKIKYSLSSVVLYIYL